MKIGFGTIVIMAIAVVVAIGLVLGFSASAPTISTTSTVTILKNASYDFFIPSDHNVSSAYLVQSSNSTAIIYVGKSPLLLNSIALINLSSGQGVSLSLSGSGSADLGVALVSSTPKSATVTLTYIPKNFRVTQSPNIKILSAGSFGAYAGSSATSPSAATTVQVSTTAKATTIPATTTVQNANRTAQAMVDVNKTDIGQLAIGFNKVFQKESVACTQSIYDNEFAATFNTAPSGPTTFKNASLVTPQGIISSAAAVGTGIYNVTYSESVASGNRLFAIVEYNLTGQSVLSSVFKGDFGSNYNAVFMNYTTLNTTSDPCAAYGV
ncbi:MAG: hypothetical protein ACYCO0_00035 [Candidatus Micrarchaeaceae archaeon]